MPKPRVLVDFDGVIHTYSRGWQDGSIYDPPMDGSIDALDALTAAGYEVVIFSTRPAEQIRPWLLQQWPAAVGVHITDRKLPAVAQIDDRAIHFVDWQSATRELEQRYPISA